MSIQYTVLGLEPMTLEQASSPITTRPGLPPVRTLVDLYWKLYSEIGDVEIND